MNTYMAHLVTGLRLLAATVLVCSIAYPAIIYAIAQTATPHTANGSLIMDDSGDVIGSRAIAQGFTRPEYLWPRPSAVNYDASSAGGSNLSPLNPALAERVTAFQSAHGEGSRPIPPELVTASGCGLDPHISLGAALFQSGRIAGARGVDDTAIEEIIRGYAFRSGGFLTPEPIVNVLEVNIALDDRAPAGDESSPEA